MSDRVGRGLTLALALAAENNDKINVETWKKALKAHAEFSPHYEAGKGKFLDMATLRLAASGDLKNLRWLLERRHADLFGGPAVDSDVDRLSINVSANASAGIPEDILERARQLATEQSKSQRPKSKADGSA